MWKFALALISTRVILIAKANFLLSSKHFAIPSYKVCIALIESELCYICNIGRRNLPDMCTQARGRAAPKGKCGHIRQVLTAHVTYVM